MEQTLHGPEVYDFRQHDQLWRRVGPGLEPYPAGGQGTQTADTGLAAVPESRLPGAEPDPCCMGTEAAELLAVLEGYITEEREARQQYLALSRQAPAWARQTLRELAEDEGGHVRRLEAVCYLITGQTRRPRAVCLQPVRQDWCTALRQSYHGEVCTAMNYARTADSTPDVCLSRLLNQLSAEEYRHADRLLALLERSMGGC